MGILRNRKSFRYALALMASASAGCIAAATPVSAQDSAAMFDYYANSDYTYCDAKLIGAFYQQDTEYGKTVIGAKIANGIEQNLLPLLGNSRNAGNRCGWVDVPHSYADAEQLAAYWGIATSSAKVKAASFYTEGKAGVITGILSDFGDHTDDDMGEDMGQDTGWGTSEDAAFASYARSGFSYCDAKLIGDLWGWDPYRGKLEIGNKVKAGLIENIPGMLNSSLSQGNRCDWSDLGYSYGDAEKMGRAWNLDTTDAKSVAARLSNKGRTDVIAAALR